MLAELHIKKYSEKIQHSVSDEMVNKLLSNLVFLLTYIIGHMHNSSYNYILLPASETYFKIYSNEIYLT